jgi:hypothetical protein
MWKEMGYAAKPSTFSETEIPITIFILILIGAVVAVKNSFKAFMIAHVFILIGFVVAGLSTYFFTQKLLDPFWWMLLVGLGLYLVYIPFNSIYFGYVVTGWASLICISLFSTGVLLILCGIFGIYLGRIFDQVKQRFLGVILTVHSKRKQR